MIELKAKNDSAAVTVPTVKLCLHHTVIVNVNLALFVIDLFNDHPITPV